MIRHKLYILAFLGFSALVPWLSIDMPRGLAFLPSLIGVVFYALYGFVFGEKPSLSWPTLWLTLIIFALSSASLLWALHFEVSLKQVTKLLVLLPPQIAMISLARSLNAEQLRPYIRIFPYAMAFSASFLCAEIISGGAVFNLVRGEPISMPVQLFEFNRGAVTLVLFTFAALAMLKTRFETKLASLAILIPLLAALYLCESQSAGLALIVGACTLFFFPYRCSLAWRGLKLGIIALMITMPFFVGYIYQNYAADLEHLPIMAQAYAGHRLEIWDYVSRYTMQSPLYGFGIEMTRATVFDSPNIFDKSDRILHPHNFAMQIWIEFGAIGILIASGLMYVFLTKIQTEFTTAQQKIILPTVMAAMVPAAFAFGLWQGWWVALLFHVAAMTLVACKFTTDEATEESAPNDAAD